MDLGTPFSDKLGFAIQPTPTKILKKSWDPETSGNDGENIIQLPS